MIYILYDILIVSSFKISFIFSLYIGILAAHMYMCHGVQSLQKECVVSWN